MSRRIHFCRSLGAAFALGFCSISQAATSSVTVNIVGSGSVQSTPVGIDCPTLCSHAFAKSDRVILQANPDDGQIFLRWSGGCAGVDTVCELRANKDATAKAVFSKNKVTPIAPVPKTGSVLCGDEAHNVISCAGTGQDGETQSGVDWPVPRFQDNGDGTVTDFLTGLIWTKRVCANNRSLDESLAIAKALSDGQCGLTDGSAVGDWRIPNIRELLSLLDFGTGSVPLNSPFTSIDGSTPFAPLNYVWSSTTSSDHTEFGQYFWSIRIGGINGSNGVFWRPRDIPDSAAWPVKVSQWSQK